MRDLKVTVDTVGVRKTVQKNYEAYSRSWAKTEAKWQAAVEAAFASAAETAAALAAANAERPTESREMAGGKTGPEYSVPSTAYSKSLLKLGSELSKLLHDRPRDFGEDYRRAIEMLSYHEGKTIELSEEEFRELMGDEWGWQRDWRNMMTSVDDHAQHYLGAAPAVTD